jgi:hypothetical protein
LAACQIGYTPPETEPLSEEEVLRQLEAFLRPRLEATRLGEGTGQSVQDIIGEIKHERKAAKL